MGEGLTDASTRIRLSRKCQTESLRPTWGHEMVLMDREHRLLDRMTNLPGMRSWLAARYERRFASNTDQNLFRGVFETYEQAMASAPESRPIGYDHPEPAAMYRQRMKELYATDYPVLFWLEKWFGSGGHRLFELGGHVGVSYYSYQKVLSFPPDLQWTIHDVPTVMERGRALASHVDGLGKLHFAPDFSQAAEADILLAMGVLQYLPETLAERLRSLRSLPPVLLINLTPLHPEATYFTLQSIGTAFCPYRIEREGNFVASLEQLGYELRDAWINPDKSCCIPFHADRSLSYYRGYCFERRA